MAHEALLGKIAHETGKPYVLPSFSKESFIDYVDHELKAHGIPDREDLVDPDTGKAIPRVLTGRQYFLKLAHQAEDKLSARGEGGYDLNELPVTGGSEGAKRLGSLQSLALLSHGVPAVLWKSRGHNKHGLWRKQADQL